MLHSFLICLHVFLALCCLPSLGSAKTGLHTNPQRERATDTYVLPKTPAHKEITRELSPQNQQKEWNIFIYIAGNNNLYRFIETNIQQALAIGSNSYINIVIQVDKFGSQEVTRSLIQKNNVVTYWRSSDVPQAERNAHPELYNSGSVQNFTDFLQSGMQKFSAKKQCVIVWNHGSGVIDPAGWRQPLNIGIPPLTRGMAFNDKYGYYLSNQDLSQALTTVSKTCLNNKPIDILGLDLCVCGQIEIAAQVKGAVQYVVASQEVELAYGWNYTKAFTRVSKEIRTPLEFSIDIINAYREEYISTMPDYTLAVYDLTQKPLGGQSTYFELLEECISDIALRLIMLMRSSQKNLIRQVLSDIRKKRTLCCDFYCNEYIDLHLFLISLQNSFRQVLNLNDFRHNYPDTARKIQDTINRCVHALEFLYKVVPFYSSGIAFSGNPMRARGISIAFPLRMVHPSYYKTTFGQKTEWVNFLKEFLLAK
ncbi:MAG: hypothetical protein QG604_263 [Candidatus Dependentiae bacterium]|nr:hypothetical protein [Candidatus Dependentiae bacterium]